MSLTRLASLTEMKFDLAPVLTVFARLANCSALRPSDDSHGQPTQQTLRRKAKNEFREAHV